MPISDRCTVSRRQRSRRQIAAPEFIVRGQSFAKSAMGKRRRLIGVSSSGDSVIGKSGDFCKFSAPLAGDRTAHGEYFGFWRIEMVLRYG